MTDLLLVTGADDDTILVAPGLDAALAASLVDAASRPPRKFGRAVRRVAIATGVAAALGGAGYLFPEGSAGRNLGGFLVLAFVLAMGVAGMPLLNVGFVVVYGRGPRTRAHEALLRAHDDDHVDLADLPWEHRSALVDVIERIRDRWDGRPPDDVRALVWTAALATKQGRRAYLRGKSRIAWHLVKDLEARATLERTWREAATAYDALATRLGVGVDDLWEHGAIADGPDEANHLWCAGSLSPRTEHEGRFAS